MYNVLTCTYLNKYMIMYVLLSVYFRILLKRGQTLSAKTQGGTNRNPRGQPHIKDRESQLPPCYSFCHWVGVTKPNIEHTFRCNWTYCKPAISQYVYTAIGMCASCC